ncbi:MAG TPA: hypothetical protein DCZ95_14010 [Verrucomicrobia bacterium]|nr:MAG: hypothetical protein A2X46_16910 [Lentisphaerae bacterium GWF2_57_35]HBA85199.1 hypothetical protein [Verrucomicrobiota bacterium]
MSVIGFVLSVNFFTSTVGVAHTLYVSLSGSDEPPYSDWDSAATSIQSAIDAAMEGDEIQVADGLYALSSPIILHKSVWLRSANGADECILDGGGMSGYFSISSRAIVDGLTMKNGAGVCLDVSDATLRQCVIDYLDSANAWSGAEFNSCIISNAHTISCGNVVFSNTVIGGEAAMPPYVVMNSTGGSNTLKDCRLINVYLDGVEPQPNRAWRLEQCEIVGLVMVGPTHLSGQMTGPGQLWLNETIVTDAAITNLNVLDSHNAQFWNCWFEMNMGSAPYLRLTAGAEGSYSNTLHNCVLKNVEIGFSSSPFPVSTHLWHLDGCEIVESVTVGPIGLSGQITGPGYLWLNETIVTNMSVTNLNAVNVYGAQFWNCRFEMEMGPEPYLKLRSGGEGVFSNTLHNCLLRNVEIGFNLFPFPVPTQPWHLDQCEILESVKVGPACISGQMTGPGYLWLYETIVTNAAMTNLNAVNAYGAQFWNCRFEMEMGPSPYLKLVSGGEGPYSNVLHHCRLKNVEIDFNVFPFPMPTLPWHLEQCEIAGQVQAGEILLSGFLSGGGLLQLNKTSLRGVTVSNLHDLICFDASISNSIVCDSPGRGIQLSGSSLLTHSRIVGNSGGGVFCDGGGIVRNCLILSNHANSGGGVLLDHGLVESCTIADNSATEGGGVLSVSGGEVINSIVWNNQAPSGSNWWESGSSAVWSYNCMAPGNPGMNNLAADPQFEPGTYRLEASSPCIDAGLNQGWMTEAKDLDDRARVVNGQVDLGAYEYIFSTSDYDGDGLSNEQEVNQYGTDAYRRDTDADGMSDSIEITAGCNPSDENSFFGLVSQSNAVDHAVSENGFVLSWYSAHSKTYQLSRADNLANGFTAVIAQGIPATPPLNVYTDTTAQAEAQYFYRVSVEVP